MILEFIIVMLGYNNYPILKIQIKLEAELSSSSAALLSQLWPFRVANI